MSEDELSLQLVKAVNVFAESINELRDDMKLGFKEIKGEIKEIKGEIKEIKGEIKEIKGEIKEIREEIKDFKEEYYENRKKDKAEADARWEEYKRNRKIDRADVMDTLTKYEDYIARTLEGPKELKKRKLS